MEEAFKVATIRANLPVEETGTESGVGVKTEPVPKQRQIVAQAGPSGREQNKCGALSVKTPDGKTIVLQDQIQSITFKTCSGNTMILDPTGLKLNVGGTVTIAASLVEINSGMLTVNAGMSIFSGTLQCD
ncbi:hypothetical protein GF407_10110, partial [candidate division KSB1 bacterium]|nr:hypothetical protein [candidate division KSB1 bacterium]